MTKQIKTWQERLEQSIGDGQITNSVDVSMAMLDYIDDLEAALAQTEQPKRPINCGTGHCSCIECVMEPAQGERDSLQAKLSAIAAQEPIGTVVGPTYVAMDKQQPYGTKLYAAPVALAQPVDVHYTIALHRAIEFHCDGKFVPPTVAELCPFHSEMLDKSLNKSLIKEQVEKVERAKRNAFEAYASGFDTFGDKWQDLGADDHFIAGYEAALLQSKPAKQALRDVLEQAAQECERTKMYPGGRQESWVHNSVWEAARAIRAMIKEIPE